MRFGERTAVRVAALALMGTSAAQVVGAEPKPGSLYLQCDGQPNNVTAGETAARLLGAVTLLGLFAPPPEASDPAKRKFGAEGVAACTALIDGDKAEGNPARRVGLILARAVHRIEAKDYPGAIADAALARKAATDAGLMANPYYVRSRGLAFDWIESAALIRQGQAVEARAAALRSAGQVRHALLPTLNMPDYSAWNRTASDEELAYFDGRGRAVPLAANDGAARFEEVGRFADAARVRDGLIDFERALSPDLVGSGPIAHAALAHALAGNREGAGRLAAAAKANADKRRADGKPDKNPGEIVEILDLYGIVDAAAQGDLKGARRLFAARSQWVSPSFGSVVEVNRRLRQGRPPTS